MRHVGLKQNLIGTVDLFSFRRGLFHVCVEDFMVGFACTWVYSEDWLETGLGSSVVFFFSSMFKSDYLNESHFELLSSS